MYIQWLLPVKMKVNHYDITWSEISGCCREIDCCPIQNYTTPLCKKTLVLKIWHQKIWSHNLFIINHERYQIKEWINEFIITLYKYCNLQLNWNYILSYIIANFVHCTFNSPWWHDLVRNNIMVCDAKFWFRFNVYLYSI